VGILAVSVAGYLSFRLMAAGSATELYHARMAHQEAQARELQRRLKQGEETRARLEANLAMTQRRCQQPRRYNQLGSYGQQGAGARGGIANRDGNLIPAAPPGALYETLGRSQIQAGMRALKGAVQACYDRYKIPGLVNIQVRIGRTGVVQSARIKGMFAGTPSGACVARAARQARFPRFSGNPITITYPFIMR